MSDLEGVRRQLEERLDVLTGRTERIGKDLRRPMSADSEERATERENDEVLERLDDVEHDEIAKIRKALARIAGGEYETCDGCGGPIGEGRLRAVPETSRCVACA